MHRQQQTQVLLVSNFLVAFMTALMTFLEDTRKHQTGRNGRTGFLSIFLPTNGEGAISKDLVARDDDDDDDPKRKNGKVVHYRRRH